MDTSVPQACSRPLSRMRLWKRKPAKRSTSSLSLRLRAKRLRVTSGSTRSKVSFHRDFHKLPAECSHDFISALNLADEYGIKLWIAALLDPEPITHGTSDPKKSIQSPPPFSLKEPVNGLGRSPEKPDGRRSTRGRSLRSASPMKKDASTRKYATPRKTRKPRGTLKFDEEAAAIAEEAAESINGDLATANARQSTENVKVEVETVMKPSPEGDEEIESTKVNIEMPAGLPELQLPNDAQEMLAQARAMVHEAEKINGTSSSSSKGKRKAEEMVEDDEDELELLPPKRVKAVQTELRKEKIKRRAITGIAAGLAFGYVTTLSLLSATLTNIFEQRANSQPPGCFPLGIKRTQPRHNNFFHTSNSSRTNLDLSNF